MPRYVSLHALGCLPKPAFASLCARVFGSDSTTRRVIAGQVGEKMLVEFDSPSEVEARAWLHTNKLVPLWLLRVDFESTDGSVTEL
jgi:hypothetical protein